MKINIKRNNENENINYNKDNNYKNNLKINIGKREDRDYNISVEDAEDVVNDLNDVGKDEQIKRNIREIAENFIESTKDNNLTINKNDKAVLKNPKEIKQDKIKRNILFFTIMFFIIGIFVFGVKQTFFFHQYTPIEMTKLVNYYNNNTNFPKDGINGYIQKNAEPILKLIMPNYTGNKTEIKKIYVTQIVDKSQTFANVYFTVKLSNINGDSTVNVVLGVYYLPEKDQYVNAGNPIISSKELNNEKVDLDGKVDNPELTFGKNPQEIEGKDYEKMKTFTTNFITILYQGLDVSSFYKGNNPINTNNAQLINIKSINIYSKKNKAGYNGVAILEIQLGNQQSVVNTNYFNIVKNGSSFIINKYL